MPIVRIEMWTGRTVAQKKELARVVTDAMVNIAHTTAEATIIVFEDIDKDNWAQAGPEVVPFTMRGGRVFVCYNRGGCG